jgi:hypothetical protein
LVCNGNVAELSEGMRLLEASCVVVAASVASVGPATKDVDDGDAWLVAHGSKDPEKRLQNACCCVEISVARGNDRRAVRAPK